MAEVTWAHHERADETTAGPADAWSTEAHGFRVFIHSEPSCSCGAAETSPCRVFRVMLRGAASGPPYRLFGEFKGDAPVIFLKQTFNILEEAQAAALAFATAVDAYLPWP